jgi:HTH-type transcriptional regulator/antitoxin HigA
MGVMVLDPKKYGRLCADVVPTVIKNNKQFDRLVNKLEELDRKEHATREEEALAELLAKLIEAYDEEHYPAPAIPPHEMVRHLMEQRGLRQADLVAVIGSRAQVSDLVNGRRGISKAQAKNLAQFFHVSVELFI